MAVSGTYLCDCGKRFEGTFSDDEESLCSACQDKVPKTLAIPTTGDFTEPRSLEEITPIPYL